MGGDIAMAYNKLFLLGVALFGIAHVLYVTAFWPWQVPYNIRDIAKWFFGTLPVSIVATLVLPHVPGQLVYPVMAYMGIIVTMGLSAFHAHLAEVNRARVGFFVFAVSDTTISVNKFAAPFEHAHLVVMVLYYLGQYLLTTSIIYANSHPAATVKLAQEAPLPKRAFFDLHQMILPPEEQKETSKKDQ